MSNLTPTDCIADRILSLKPYQPGKPIEEVKRELGIEGEIIKLASNENPLGPSPAAIAALESKLPKMALYPDGGCHELRQTVAQKLDIPDDWLIFGNGSDEVIHLLGLAFLTPGDEMVIGDPTFVLYEASAILSGATTIKVPLTRPGYVHDTEAMADAFSERTRLVFIANPHNPTGTVVYRRQIDSLVERLPSRAILVLDEAYYEYGSDLPDFPNSIDYIRAGANVIGLRTFSKMYGLAGLRVGYGIARPEIIRVLNQPRSPFNVNLAGQIAATAAVNDDACVERGKQVNAEGILQLTDAFTDLGLTFIPTYANFIMVDVKRPCRKVFNELLRRGVIIRVFDDLPTMLRITIGTEAQNDRFLTALREILPTISEVGE